MLKPLLASLAILLGVVAVAARAAEKSPLVVELYTSEGCNSCPPADAYLGTLAKRRDLLALSFHVDYWDYLGWKDTFASRAATDRQRAYSATLGSRYVYTPQLVIGGRTHVVGSDRGAVDAAIGEAETHASPVAMSLRQGPAGKLVVQVPAGQSHGQAVLWLVRYDGERSVKIGAGENGGKTLTYYNVVRDFRRIGTWNGSPTQVTLDAADMRGTDHCAVLLQEQSEGPILGALRLPDMPAS